MRQNAAQLTLVKMNYLPVALAGREASMYLGARTSRSFIELDKKKNILTERGAGCNALGRNALRGEGVSTVRGLRSAGGGTAPEAN